MNEAGPEGTHTCNSTNDCDPSEGRCVARACRDSVANFHELECTASPDVDGCNSDLNACALGGEECKLLSCIDATEGNFTDNRILMLGTMTMRTSLLRSTPLLALLVLPALSCRSEFPTQESSSILEMKLTGGSPGKATELIPLNFTTPDTYTFDITALDGSGNVDPTFNGYVRLSSHPGTVSTVTGSGAEGRNVLLVNGIAKGVGVDILGAYGNTHIWAEDIGYKPADPIPEAGAPEPQCSDGIDNNDNGLIDFPADPGCAYANDDTEDEGTFATGISEIIFYASPRVADVRGISQGGSATSFPNEQVDLDVGYRATIPCQDGSQPPCYDFSVIVTRIAATGFYVSDISDKRGFNNVYAYNFSAPPNMSVCDRLTSFGGTSADFYGFTEINYPTWSLDEWRGPFERPCACPMRPCSPTSSSR